MFTISLSIEIISHLDKAITKERLVSFVKNEDVPKTPCFLNIKIVLSSPLTEVENVLIAPYFKK